MTLSNGKHWTRSFTEVGERSGRQLNSLPSFCLLVDCKYRFGSWGECDQSTGSQTRIGTLKRALNNAECQQTVSLSKPCSKLRRKPGKTTGSASEDGGVTFKSWQRIHGINNYCTLFSGFNQFFQIWLFGGVLHLKNNRSCGSLSEELMLVASTGCFRLQWNRGIKWTLQKWFSHHVWTFWDTRHMSRRRPALPLTLLTSTHLAPVSSAPTSTSSFCPSNNWKCDASACSLGAALRSGAREWLTWVKPVSQRCFPGKKRKGKGN